jgi:hypothetical protein
VANVRVSHDAFAAHSEPAVAENPRHHRDLIAGSKLFTDPAHYRFKIGTYFSADGGRTWHDSGPLPGFSGYGLTSDVSIAFASDGTGYVCVLALQGKKSGVFVSRTTDGGKTFSAPVPVFLDSSGQTFSDKPWIAVDQTDGPHAGTIYVAWNLDPAGTDADAAPKRGSLGPQAPGDPTTGLVLARSTNGGRTFSRPVLLAPFGDLFAIGAIPAVGPDGTVYVAYASIDKNGQVTELRMVTSTDGGATFGPPQTSQTVDGLPDHLPGSTFRNLTLPAFAVSPQDGALVVAWADMRNGDADVLASSSSDGGTTWSQPVRVNHDPVGDGKDQFQPALAVAPNGTFTCSWFDRRFDPNNRLIDVEIAQSTDDGLTFGTNVRVTKKPWNPAIDAPLPEGKRSNTFIGDYQALAVDNATVHPLWNDTENSKSQEIRTGLISVQIFARH